MRIVLIRQHFDAAYGGAERYAVNLGRALLERGHDIDLVCSTHSAVDADGMQVHHVGRSRLAGPWRHLAFSAKAGKVARSVGADVVVALARALGADVFRLGDPPHWHWMRLRYGHGEAFRRACRNPRHWSLLRLEQRMMMPQGAQHFVANSGMVRDQMVHAYGVDPARFSVFHNPVDPQRFNPEAGVEGDILRAELGIGDHELVLLFSGMEYLRKGLMPAVNTFIELSARSESEHALRFVCVGKGDVSEAKASLREAGLEQRAVFSPPVADIQRWYGMANVFLLPTLYDPSANAVGEALACGTPVVTTGLNGASELIRSGENGIVLGNRDDVGAWGAAVSRLLAHERAQRSRQYVAMQAKLPTPSEHVDAWEGLLGEIAAGKLRKTLSLGAVSAEKQASRMLLGGRSVIFNDSERAREIRERLPFLIPVHCFNPDRANVIKDHRGSIVAAVTLKKARLRKDDLFAPATPVQVYVKVRADDPEAGEHEFSACLHANAHGVNAMLPVAAGSDGRRSFIITEAAPGLLLPSFLRKHCLGRSSTHRIAKRRVLEAVADAAAAFHASGMNHRDFYATHLFVSLEVDGRERITFIDLQRAQIRASVPLRWLVKDLGQLHFSLSSALVSRTERLRFLRRYLWKLGRPIERRALLRAISRRVEFIAGRLDKVLARRAQSDEQLRLEQQRGSGALQPATLADIERAE